MVRSKARKNVLNSSITQNLDVTYAKKEIMENTTAHTINQKQETLNSPVNQKVNKVNKGKVADNYTTSTYLVRNDLKNKLDALASSSTLKRGAKTAILNEALFHLFNDNEYLEEVMQKLRR